MISQQRFYSGNSFLPKPRIDLDANLEIMILTMNWGDPLASDFFIDALKYQLTNIQENTEVTRIGQKVEPLSQEMPELGPAVAAAHEQLQRKFNSQEYTTVLELLILKRQGHLVQWLKSGGPSLLLANSQKLICLEHTHSLAAQHNQSAPLVTQGLGIGDHPVINQGSFRINSGEKILLVNANLLPPALYSTEIQSLDSWARALAHADPHSPFWIGIAE